MDEQLYQTLTFHKEELQNIHSEWSTQSDYHQGFNVCEFSWLPEYFVKYGIERYENSVKLRNKIMELNLKSLAVPEKYLFRLYDDNMDTSNTNTIVIAKKINGRIGKGSFQVNLDTVKQLCTIAMKTPHYDIHRMNLVLSESDGKIYIIDTDVAAMPSDEEHNKLYNDWLVHGTRLHNRGGIIMNLNVINHPYTKMELSMYSKHNNYTNEAYKYLENLLDETEKERLVLKSQVYGLKWCSII